MDGTTSASCPMEDFNVEISGSTTRQNLVDGCLNIDGKNGNQNVRKNEYLLASFCC
jgi:hypothetical protein